MLRDTVRAGASPAGQSGGRSDAGQSTSIWATCAPTVNVMADRSRRLIRAVLSGMLTLDDVESFYRSELEAVQAMGCRTGEFFLIVETRGNVVQSREVMDAFQRLIEHSPVKAKRIAIVRAGALSSMQTRRIAKAREGVEVFDSVKEAEAWLFRSDSDQLQVEKPNWATL